MKKIVFIIAENNFRDEELLSSKEVLENSGFECSIASKNKGVCIGALGAKAESTLALGEIGGAFDAIVFIGGPGAKQFFHDSDALGLARKYFDLEKIVCAIGISPVILANSGVLMGKRATCSPNEKQNLQGKCFVFTGKQVEIDGAIITSSGLGSSKVFGEEIAKKLQ